MSIIGRKEAIWGLSPTAQLAVVDEGEIAGAAHLCIGIVVEYEAPDLAGMQEGAQRFPGRTLRQHPLFGEGQGVARLLGKSVRERAEELIAVAHPDHRDWLRDEARRLYFP